jgi:hypothetical protein
MPIPTAWRAQQTTDTTGTGPLTLNAADTSRRSFATALGVSSTAALYLISQSGSSSWEIAAGIFNGTTGLTRGTCLASSNGGAAVSWGAGRKDVILLSAPGQRGRVTFTGATSAALADLGCLLDFTGSTATTLTLPAAANVPAGVGYLVRNTGSAGAMLTVDGNASELVGAASAQVLFAGETMELWSTGTGWVHSALAAVALVRTQVPTVAALLDFALPSSGVLYEFRVNSVVLSSAGQLLLRTSTDGGSTFASSAGNYQQSYLFVSGASTVTGGNAAGTELILSASGPANNVLHGSGEIAPGNGAYGARVQSRIESLDSGGTLANSGNFGGNRVAAGAVNAIRFLPSSGNFAAAGFIALYARRY